jgi:hypothetical protein
MSVVTPPTPAYTHIFAVAGTLRVPSSQPQKRHIQMERYAKLFCRPRNLDEAE